MKASISKQIGVVAMAMLLVVVGVTGLVLLPKEANADLSWPGTIGGEDFGDWEYRVPMTVNNKIDDYPMLVIVGYDAGEITGLGEGTNKCYNVEGEIVTFTFDTDGNCSPSPDKDCRFLVYDGGQWKGIPFWEDIDGPGYAMFWVKNLYNSSTIWLYYGNDDYYLKCTDSTFHSGWDTFDYFIECDEDDTELEDDWTWDTGFNPLSYHLDYVQQSNYHPCSSYDVLNCAELSSRWAQPAHAMNEDVDVEVPFVVQFSTSYTNSVGEYGDFSYVGVSDESIESGHDADAVLVGIRTYGATDYYKLESIDDGDNDTEGQSSGLNVTVVVNAPYYSNELDYWTITVTTDEVTCYYDGGVPDYNYTGNELWSVDGEIPDGTMHPYLFVPPHFLNEEEMYLDYFLIRPYTNGTPPSFSVDSEDVETQS